MKVFKFGGASVNNVDRIKNLGILLQEYKAQKTIIVISAFGKTTNALEKLTDAFFDGNKEQAQLLFEQIKQQHLNFSNNLLVTHSLSCEAQLNTFFTELEWLLHDNPLRQYDYYYDQIVCVGELLSTTIISYYLNENGITNKWIDVRDIIRTDNNFRDSSIDWEITNTHITKSILPLFEKTPFVITQGFIGATDENESTTLGREGSDFTAAIFANLLNAESLTIWKDVPSIMNSDPKQFSDAKPIAKLNYTEIIEMAYYGAQVIHPKTIKPLQNKNIPLYVKCFLDPTLPGTIVDNHPVKNLPPIIVLKENQVMMELSSKDFSFVEEKPIAELFLLLEKLKLKPNLTQNGAISILCVLDDSKEKIETLASAAASQFEVKLTKGLTLLTVRHYTDELVSQLTAGKNILLQQKTIETVQTLMQ